MYLHLSISIFSKYFSYLNKSDEYKIKDIIVSDGIFLIGYFWHETNIELLYELFGKFGHINKSYCYNNKKNKPEIGLYYPSPFDATLEVIFL